MYIYIYTLYISFVYRCIIYMYVFFLHTNVYTRAFSWVVLGVCVYDPAVPYVFTNRGRRDSLLGIFHLLYLFSPLVF